MRYVLVLLCALKVCLAQGYVVDTIAGNGIAGLSGDGGPAIRGMVNTPGALALDSLGRLYIADRGNSLVRRVDTNGQLSTVATSPDAAIDDIAVDSRTTLYIVAGNRVRAIAASGDETEIQGPQGSFTAVRTIAVDSAGNLLIGDGATLVSVSAAGASVLATLPDTIRSIGANPSGGAVVIAGSQLYSVGADGSVSPIAGASPATEGARVAVDKWGDIYVSGVRVTKLIGGKEYQLIGLGDPGYSGDGGPAVAASVMNPSGLVVDRGGNVFFSDTGNQRVRFLRPNQVASINAVLPGDAAQEIWPKTVQLRWTVLSSSKHIRCAVRNFARIAFKDRDIFDRYLRPAKGSAGPDSILLAGKDSTASAVSARVTRVLVYDDYVRSRTSGKTGQSRSGERVQRGISGTVAHVDRRRSDRISGRFWRDATDDVKHRDGDRIPHATVGSETGDELRLAGDRFQ